MPQPRASGSRPGGSPGGRGPRADARLNRRRLLDAAAEAFNAHGAGASLDDIARSAGVGNATLYRHFPTRQALVAAVYAELIQQLCDAAGELRSTRPAGDALVEWLHLLVEHMTGNRGLRDAFVAAYQIRDDEESPETAEWHRMTRSAVGPLVEDAQAAGKVRTDIDVDDLLALTVATAHAGNGRLLRLALEGVLTGRTRPRVRP